jgi:hypothetical protein
MKKSSVFFAIIFSLIIVGCNQQSTTQYYKQVIGVHKSLLDSIDIIKADANFSPVINAEKAQVFTKRKLNELAAIEAPKSGAGLKEAVVNEIEALYSYNNTLLEMTKLAENDTAIIALQDKLVAQKNILEQCDDKLVIEQEKFAKAHSFRLENK